MKAEPQPQGQTEPAPRLAPRHVVSVQLTPEEVADLRMLKSHLWAKKAHPFFPTDEGRDTERYMRIVDKILSAV